MLVTGAASGIGLECATLLAEAGHRVAMIDLRADRLAEAGAAVAGASAADTVSTHVADLTDSAAAHRAVEAAAAEHGGLAAIVNAAGAVRAGTVTATSDEDWHWNLQTNVSSAFYVCRAALRHLIDIGGGAVVNIASLTALRPMTDRAGYAAAKGAVISFTRQLALEYGPHGISANTVCPGAIRTPLLAARFDAEPEAERDLQARIPARRVGEPREVAELVALLVSGRCGYLTGQTISVDGGLSLV